MNQYCYFPILKIGQASIGGLPYGKACMQIYIERRSKDMPNTMVHISSILLNDFKKWIDDIVKDHTSSQAKKSIKNLREFFGKLFLQINKDNGFYDYERGEVEDE